ncbi:nicotinamide N-methyltransferase [Alligator mississippiensis]|uniref:Nicotinamide N-methyltransferase n=1 Tax=Alligator mississippiensis TaxID=8496 RepID=A0A151NU00_ALLMI|nr:nicotinamide N-methyltransferase [Alligator mississippiensis]KYO39915.1 nicotinamide N-methyltransferase [Alligator mississippiensis]
MAELTEEYVLEADYDPKAYMEFFNLNENSLEYEFIKFVLRHHYKTFTPGAVKGDTLISISNSPAIYPLLSACETFKEIIIADCRDQNCQELQKWLKQEPGAFDWSQVGKYMCELEGGRHKWTEKEGKLRKTISHILKCDVHESKPLGPDVLPPADCLVSSFCLETVCKDQSSYRAALKNISSLLKPGGHLVLSGDLGTSFYMVGPKKFFCLVLTEEFLRGALSAAGFAIQEFDVLSRDDDTMQEICDCSGMYFIVARKEKVI